MSSPSISSASSVSQWLNQLKAGDRGGAQELWQRYFHRLVGLARAKLQGLRPLLSDEEDVALSAFHSFCRGAEGIAFRAWMTATISGKSWCC